MALRVRISAMPSVTLMYGCHCHCAQFSLSACGGIFGRMGFVVVVVVIVLSVCSGISDADVWASDIQRRLQHLPDVPQGDPRDTAENETGGNR